MKYMKTTINNILFASVVGVLLLLSSCDTTDPIYNTPYPNQGTIILSTNWGNTNITQAPAEGVTVAIDEYKAIVTKNPFSVDNLFSPKSYKGYVYNTVEEIAISGTGENTVATIPIVPGTNAYLKYTNPGFLYSGTKSFVIEKDKENDITVDMKQQVRELTLLIFPQGGDVELIDFISATLSGVARSWNLDSDKPEGYPSNVEIVFTKITTGDYIGAWKGTVRILGVIGDEQKLYFRINTKYPTGYAVDEFEVDISTNMKNFNSNKKSPLVLNVINWSEYSTITIDGTEPLVSEHRLFRDAIPSTFESPKQFPGTQGVGSYFFKTETISPPIDMVTVSCEWISGSYLFMAGYLDSFDINNLETNYLGDPGSSPTAGKSHQMEVIVPYGKQLVLSFMNCTTGSFGKIGYTVSGKGAKEITGPITGLSPFNLPESKGAKLNSGKILKDLNTSDSSANNDVNYR